MTSDYNDNTTRNTTDGSGVKGLDWNNRMMQRRNGYYARQLTNSTLLSTHQELYSMPRRNKGIGAVIGICLIFIVLYVGVLELNVLDEFYVWLIGE